MRSFKDERGIAMIVAIGVLLILLLLTGAVVSTVVSGSDASNRDTREKRAFEAANAGLQETLYRLNMVINSNSTYSPTALQALCLGSSISVSGAVTVNTEQLESPTSFYGSVACGPYTESLGNGAFYTSWTTIAYVGSHGTCAGVNIGTNSLVTERCVVSQGFVCPSSYTSVSQLPCPNPVVHRVEERVAADSGKPVFPSIAGIFGLNGVLIENSAQVLGSVATNKQLALLQTAVVTQPASLGPAAPNPLIQNSALLGLSPACSKTSSTFPSNCVTRLATPFTLTSVAPPPASPDPASSSSVFTSPDGDARISNAFTPSYSNPTNPHDTFIGCNSAASCGWDPATRTLNVPNGVTWTLGGSNYNFCTLSLNGTSYAIVGGSTAIYIDSPSDDPQGCPAASGYLQVNNQAQFINNVPPLPGSPLPFNTTALEIWVTGPGDAYAQGTDTWNNNDCSKGSDPKCVTLGQGGTFYGVVYAPTSDVQVSNTGKNYGAIAGATVTYNNPGTFTQDVNAATLVTTGALGVYFRTAWTECMAQPTSVNNPLSGC